MIMVALEAISQSTDQIRYRTQQKAQGCDEIWLLSLFN